MTKREKKYLTIKYLQRKINAGILPWPKIVTLKPKNQLLITISHEHFTSNICGEVHR